CFTAATGMGSPVATTLHDAHRTATPGMTPPATASGAWITLAPKTGLPGTVVQISGFLPGGPTAAQAQANTSFGYGHICWAACPGGLTYGGVPVQWSRTQAGQFTLQFTVPPVPVL